MGFETKGEIRDRRVWSGFGDKQERQPARCRWMAGSNGTETKEAAQDPGESRVGRCQGTCYMDTQVQLRAKGADEDVLKVEGRR